MALFMAQVPAVAVLSGNGHGDIGGPGRVSERADADEVDAGFSVSADSV
jgi:hypothetical protein